MNASQMVGTVPVPVNQDSVAEEMAYVLGQCGARFVVAGDQEQVHKVLEGQDQVSGIAHIIYVDPRVLRIRDHSRRHAFRASTEGADPGISADHDSGAIGDHHGCWRGNSGLEGEWPQCRSRRSIVRRDNDQAFSRVRKDLT